MNCKNCGAPLSEGAKFCKKCGAEVLATEAKPGFFAALRERCKGNRVVLYPIAGGMLLLVVALIIVLSAVSCSRRTLKTPEAVADAVIAALEKGSGDTLCALAKTAEPFLGRHTEQFGEGNSPADVMRGYYDTLADSLYGQLQETYGKGFTLRAELTSERITGTGVFEPNRALDIDAEQYAVLTGPLIVSDRTVATLRLVAVQLGSEWKLLVVYVY